MPAGLDLNAATGNLSGTPTAAGTFTFSVKAENDFGADTQEFTVVIAKGDGAVVATPELDSKTETTITIVAVEAPANGQTVEYGINTSDTAPSDSWQTELTFTGLTANTAYYIFARAAENNNYNAGEASAALEVTTGTAATPPVITTTTLPNGKVGEVYNATLAATGATPITWSIDDGELPDGLVIATEGLISGTPSVKGTFDFTVKATNAAGSDTKALQIVVTDMGIDVQQASGLLVYPNPAVDNLKIVRSTNAKAYVAIYSSVGAMVKTFETTEAVTDVDVSSLPSGVYLIRMLEGNSVSAVRFIK